MVYYLFLYIYNNYGYDYTFYFVSFLNILAFILGGVFFGIYFKKRKIF